MVEQASPTDPKLRIVHPAVMSQPIVQEEYGLGSEELPATHDGIISNALSIISTLKMNTCVL
jgi:hypothetical protein